MRFLWRSFELGVLGPSSAGVERQRDNQFEQLHDLGPFICLPGRLPANAKSLRRRFRQQVDHRHAGDNERNADHCGRIQALIEETPTDQRDENDPDAGPHRIRNSDWNAVER
jgi:hypothetical protein